MNEFFHLEHKTEVHKSRGYSKNVSRLDDLFCLDHQVAYCRCGWEWGKHYFSQLWGSSTNQQELARG